MIRPTRADDIPRLKELGLMHEFGKDFIEGICAVDEHDMPILFVGAWHRAEVHCSIDHKWSTPGARLALLQQVHVEMERELKRRDIGQVVTWFGGELKGFKRRLQRLGWIKSEFTGWTRRVY